MAHQYTSIAIGVDDAVITTVDRPHPDAGVGRIINIEIGCLTIMLGGKDEARTERELALLLDAILTLHAASVARLARLSEPE
jgi:hypothetical protein